RSSVSLGRLMPPVEQHMADTWREPEALANEPDADAPERKGKFLGKPGPSAGATSLPCGRGPPPRGGAGRGRSPAPRSCARPPAKVEPWVGPRESHDGCWVYEDKETGKRVTLWYSRDRVSMIQWLN